MNRTQVRFIILNIGHFLDHFFILIFSSVAALRLIHDWDMSYAQLIPYATPGLVAFGICSFPSGWIADKWSRKWMLVIFFIGTGLSSICTSFANSPLEIALCLTLVGVFASIYHPVGLAMVIQGQTNMGIRLAINGVFGNMGVACAALITGFLIDNVGWRSAFYAPGLVSVFIGVAYFLFEKTGCNKGQIVKSSTCMDSEILNRSRSNFFHTLGVILIATALGGIVFQCTTFALPKIFDERLNDLAATATLVGFYTFVVFSLAAFAQLIVGYLLDNYNARSIYICLAILQTVFFANMIHLTGMPALFISIAFMLAVFGTIPVNDVLIGRLASGGWRSRAYALTYLVNFTISAIAVPLIAAIHAAWGFDKLFWMLAILAFLTFIAVSFLPKEIQARRNLLVMNT